MKRTVQNWTIEQLYKARNKLSFPEYQRQPNLWSREKKGLLVDSIFRDIDIPKLYFNKTASDSYEVVDGQQRLWAIWEFLDDVYEVTADGKSRKFSSLSQAQKDTIWKFKLQITELADADDDYLRELFLRLQLGLLLITGEKLNAATGSMKEFVFRKLASDTFVVGLGIANRRFAKETLCAQICINSFTKKKLDAFSRTRYEDLLYFFKEYEHPQGTDLQFFRDQCRSILTTFEGLSSFFGSRANELKNRSYVLSIYLLFEEARSNRVTFGQEKKLFVDFVFLLWRRLREEVTAGMDRQNRELYAFESLLSSAPGEKYQIERRHQKLGEYYAHYRKTKRIKGD